MVGRIQDGISAATDHVFMHLDLLAGVLRILWALRLKCFYVCFFCTPSLHLPTSALRRVCNSYACKFPNKISKGVRTLQIKHVFQNKQEQRKHKEGKAPKDLEQTQRRRKREGLGTGYHYLSCTIQVTCTGRMDNVLVLLSRSLQTSRPILEKERGSKNVQCMEGSSQPPASLVYENIPE